MTYVQTSDLATVSAEELLRRLKIAQSDLNKAHPSEKAAARRILRRIQFEIDQHKQ